MKKEKWMTHNKFGVANMDTGLVACATDVRYLKNTLRQFAEFDNTPIENIQFYSDCDKSISWMENEYKKYFNYYKRYFKYSKGDRIL